MAIVILNPNKDKLLRGASQEIGGLKTMYKGLFFVSLALNVIFLLTLIYYT